MSKRLQGTLDSFFISPKSKYFRSDNNDIVDETISENGVSNLNFTEELDLESRIVNQNVVKDMDARNTSVEQISDERDPVRGNQHALKFLNLKIGPFQPKNIDFPKRNSRKFRQVWYDEYKWLEYSPSADSAYCFYCRAFPSGQSKFRDDQTFISNGYNNWKKAVEKFRDHQKSISHKEACSKVSGFLSTQTSGPITSKVESYHDKLTSENRLYLKCILESLLFCARQGIGLRGHREDGSSLNKGNLLELMNIRAKDNEIVNRYFIQKEKTFKYVSPEYQNLFLKYMANNVLKNIVSEIQLSGIFGIMIDETQDLSRHEQVSFVVRYVDSNLVPHEVFLGFRRTEKCDAESLAKLIKSELFSHGLRIKDIRAQCYDGAAAMRGSYSGVQSRLRAENNLAIYIHCYAHILNLCIVDVSKQIVYVRNSFGILNSLHNFIGASGKRQAIFEKMQSAMSNEKKIHKSLKSLSDTRWSCRVEALRSVDENLHEIIKTLQEIVETDTHSGPEANGLLKSIETFEFVFCMKLLKKILMHTNILSKYLQSSTIDYNAAIQMINETKSTLMDLRSEESFTDLWKEASEISSEMELIPPHLPRKKFIPIKLGGGKQQQDLASPKDHYRSNIYFAVLDIIINEMTHKFQENDLKILNALSNILIKKNPENKNYDLLKTTYDINIEELKAEVKIFNRLFETSGNSDSFENRVAYIKDVKSGFENLYLLYKIFLTIPVSTASCERSFSSLRRLKTYLRMTTGQERLNDLAILYIERQIDINFDMIIDTFDSESGLRGRRLTFT